MSFSDILQPGLPFFIAKRNLAEIANNVATKEKKRPDRKLSLQARAPKSALPRITEKDRFLSKLNTSLEKDFKH